MIKKVRFFVISAAVAGSCPVQAFIDDGKFGDPGELFISVYDSVQQKSYYKDLGITMTQFMKGEGCIPDLSTDEKFSVFKGKPGLVYNIAAVNPLVKDSSNNPVNITTWGYLATSSEGSAVFKGAWNAIDNTKQKIQGYIGNLNVEPFTHASGQAADNKSGIFGPTDPGYHGNPIWGSNMGSSVKGNTEGTPGKALEFYFVNNTNGDNQGQISLLGAWNLSESGQLSYSGSAGTTKICEAANQKPVAKLVSTSLSVNINTQVVLDGSSSNDPDNGPQPLTYSWSQIAGPTMILANATQSKANFTPTQSGTYGFELTVSDGRDTGKATVTVNVKTPQPVGPSIKLNAPTTYKVGQVQTIAWTTVEVGEMQIVKVLLAMANNPTKFKTLKSVVNKKHQTTWKPAKSLGMQQGILKLCVNPSKDAPNQCDQQNITIQK